MQEGNWSSKGVSDCTGSFKRLILLLTWQMILNHSLDMGEHNLQSSDLVTHCITSSALPAGSQCNYRTAKYINFWQISTNTILLALPVISVEQNYLFLKFLFRDAENQSHEVFSFFSSTSSSSHSSKDVWIHTNLVLLYY